jgi:hypothetical protein
MAYPYPPSDDSRLVRDLSVPIYQAKGWLKFLGILSIIGGVGQALSVVGIVIAWLPIWMGVLLFQAGSNIEPAGQLGDKFGFQRSMSALKTYFVLQGVLTLLSIFFVVTMLCILFILPLIGITLIPWQDLYYNNYYY